MTATICQLLFRDTFIIQKEKNKWHSQECLMTPTTWGISVCNCSLNSDLHRIFHITTSRVTMIPLSTVSWYPYQITNRFLFFRNRNMIFADGRRWDIYRLIFRSCCSVSSYVFFLRRLNFCWFIS